MLAFAPPKEMATQKDSFHNRWRFSQTWNKLQITERTMLMWDLNPNKTRLMQQHDTLRNLLNIIYWIFFQGHQVTKDTWVRDTLLATDCPRQPRHNKAKATAQVATASTLFKATTSWSWTQLAPGLWGRCLFKLRFCDEAKTPFATHTPKARHSSFLRFPSRQIRQHRARWKLRLPRKYCACHA